MPKKDPKQNLLDILEPENKKEEVNPLAGFEEFIQSHNIHIHKNTSMDKSDEGKIQSFLVNNYQRISKISDLFQQKLKMLEKFDQSEQSIKNLEIENEVFLEKIINKSLSNDSLINRSLSAIFNAHFKEID